MKAIIFDLDNTLYATSICQPYLRTDAGRRIIPQLIREGKIVVKAIDDNLITYINKIIKDNDFDVYISSDSPKEYCLSIIDTYGLNVSHENVFGNQHKPCAEEQDFYFHYEQVLVIGDSPKDIYFAHLNEMPSVLFGDLAEDKIRYYNYWTMPTRIATHFKGLKEIIEEFAAGGLKFSQPKIPDGFITLDPRNANIVDIESKNIGYSKEYWPSYDDCRDHPERIYVWYDVKRSIKVAKELTIEQLNNKIEVLFYNSNGKIAGATAFRRIAWFYFEKFKEWILNKKIEGNVYLVPAPSSSPFECNNSFPMSALIDWWRVYAYHDVDLRISIIESDRSTVVERFWPTRPAHLSNGKREVLPHLETLGVYKKATPFEDADTVIIIDDVVTSGTQMKAIATLLIGTGIVNEDVPLYGYALVKTTRPGSSLAELLRLLGEAELSGG